MRSKHGPFNGGERMAKYEDVTHVLPCLCGSPKTIPLVDCQLMVVVVECQHCGQRSSERQCLLAAINNWNKWVRWMNNEVA